MMRNIIGQTKSSFDLRQVMDDGKILLVNLSRGRVGELNSKLLGMIFVMKFEAAAMSRADIPEEYRKDFCLYVDEFQNFSTDSFADILSQARKYHLNLIVANQFTTQLTDEIRDAVFGNVGTVVSYRVGTTDAEFLAKQFAPVFDIEDLQFIPNYNTVVRMQISGVPVQPFSMAILPPLGSPNKQLGDALKQLSAAKYGRPRAAVEAEIFKRLATQPSRPQLGTTRPGAAPPWPASGYGSAYCTPQAAPSSFGSARPPTGSLPPPARPAGTGSSFLDEWLTKRRTKGTPAPGSAVSAFGSAGPPTAASPWANQPSAGSVVQPSAQPNPGAAASTPSAAANPASPPAQNDTFKINHDHEHKLAVSQSSAGAEHTMHIDKDGNISYEDSKTS